MTGKLNSPDQVTQDNQAIATVILNFWFGDPTLADSPYGQQRPCWFCKDVAFDAAIHDRFLTTYQAARRGTYDHWRQTPQGALALVILLDQLPRNMFRGTAESFASDKQALETAQWAISQSYDQTLIPVERMFLYLPLEHSENLTHQTQCVALFEALVQIAPELQSTLDYAYRHQDVIAQFGRFPHRNTLLGRESTPAELAFLGQPGSRF
jgi:uncharacterized protein (DUF924 family)